MRNRHAILIGILLQVASMIGAAAEEPVCNVQLRREAAIDLSLDGFGVMRAPVTIGGQTRQFLIDTTSDFSMIKESAASAMSLQGKPLPNGKKLRALGYPTSTYVKPSDIRIGNMTLPSLSMLVVSDKIFSEEDDGILGTALLSFFDVDFDFANAKLNLFAQDHCPGQVVYWPHKAVTIVPIEGDPHQIKVMLMVDGKPLLAYISTIKAISFMNLQTAEKLFNFDSSDPQLKPFGSVPHEYIYPFKMLSLGGVTVNNPHLVLVDYKSTSDDSEVPNVVLGMDVLRELHLFISYKEKKLYITSATAQ